MLLIYILIVLFVILISYQVYLAMLSSAFIIEGLENNDTTISSYKPYYLLNKIEESNLVIGRQQLEAYDQIINIFKNKNREEKVENLKRIHIQKCIQWCEKNQLPHNKFTDNVNIFLTLKKRPMDEFKIDS